MKRPLQLSLAIALALGGTNALALGLGPVHVKSKLNQPLDAEIPVLQGTAAEAEGLIVNMAGSEDFERLGLSRSRLTVPLEFALVKGAHGDLVIKVTSKEPVRDSYLDFLVEANWPKGRLLREYTVLLDPPVMAPSTHAATTAAVAPSPSTTTLTHREKPAKAATAAPAPRPEAAARVAAKPERATPAHKVNAGEYGPVAAGETLTEVARAARQGENANINQMMLALLKNNPNAFYKDNINALKRGAILRVPSADELKAVGSAREAAAQVHAQLEDWRGSRASPTLVADTGTAKSAKVGKAAKTEPSPAAAAKPKATAAAAKSGNEHLELVPPKAGRDSIAMADRPGSGAGSPAATTELKSELARAKEALTTRDQETGELKSRVKELEDLKNKNDRLIGLKDSEIAELQQKLKQLQEKPAVATAPVKPAATTAATVPPSEAAKVAAPVLTTKPAMPATPPLASAPPATVATSMTTPPASASTTKSVASGETKIDKQDIWGNAGTDAAKLADAGKAEPVPGVAPRSASGPAGPTATTIPLAAAPPTSDVARPPVATPKPVTTTPAKPAIKTAPPQRPADAEPWYTQGWVKSAALVAGILLLLAGLFGMRKRQVAPATAARGSIADAFGDSPLTGSGDGAHTAGSMEAEEADLREQLQHDPGNVGLHLELLSIYYAGRDVARFEDTAAEMHQHVTDPHEPEWLEAQAMGQELAPGNPLFAGAAHYDDTDAMTAAAHADTIERPVYTDRADGFVPAAYAHTDPAHLDPDFTFDAAKGEPTYAAPAMPAPVNETAFDFDDLPPLEFGKPAASGAAAAAVGAAAGPAKLDDDYFAGDDAIGTKLDLAKAYMDMGDPEGARSMLEEVVAEGNDAQKAEAHKLIADLR